MRTLFYCILALAMTCTAQTGAQEASWRRVEFRTKGPETIPAVTVQSGNRYLRMIVSPGSAYSYLQETYLKEIGATKIEQTVPHIEADGTRVELPLYRLSISIGTCHFRSVYFAGIKERAAGIGLNTLEFMGQFGFNLEKGEFGFFCPQES